MEVQKTGNHLFFRASGRETTLFALGNYCRATKIIPTWRHGRRTIEALKKIKILNIWKSLKESSKLVRMFRSKITCIDAKLIWIHQVEVAGVLEKKRKKLNGSKRKKEIYEIFYRWIFSGKSDHIFDVFSMFVGVALHRLRLCTARPRNHAAFVWGWCCFWEAKWRSRKRRH